MPSSFLLGASETAALLPWQALVEELERLLADTSVTVPPRLVHPLPAGASLFVMPASDSDVAISKLITFTPANAGSSRPTIQGDVLAFDVKSGARVLALDGPTVTARRTAAVSALAAKKLASQSNGALLVIGAGVQGRAHVEAFAEVLGVRKVLIASRTDSNGRSRSAEALASHAKSLGLDASVTDDANAALADCPLAVTCTPANQIVLHGQARVDGFIAAVGAFTPRMVELDAALCRSFAECGSIFVDTADAVHEAGDLLQAGLDVSKFKTLADVIRLDIKKPAGPVLFKSCGWAGWDLAAARAALLNRQRQ